MFRRGELFIVIKSWVVGARRRVACGEHCKTTILALSITPRPRLVSHLVGAAVRLCKPYLPTLFTLCVVVSLCWCELLWAGGCRGVEGVLGVS